MLTPLILSLLHGCIYRCGGGGPEEERFGYNEDDLAQLAAAARPAIAPTGGTADTSAATADTSAATTDTGLVDLIDADCSVLCEASGAYNLTSCEDLEPRGAEVRAVRCNTFDECVGGRFHAVVAPQQAAHPDPVAAYLAQQAHDEWASVHAFQALAAELEQHGAPSALIARVHQAARDEVGHARTLGDLARSRGATVPTPILRVVAPRSLEEVARENVEEAIVVEAWSAVRAWVQARHAAPALRSVFATIAREETVHTELARDLDAWFRSQLDDAACTRLDLARDQAVDRLLQSPGPTDPSTQRILGLPDDDEARRLLHGLRGVFWR